MNKPFVYILLLISIFICESCRTSNDNVYYFHESYFKHDSATLLRKSEKIKLLAVMNYADSIFPNTEISKLTKIEGLQIYSKEILNGISIKTDSGFSAYNTLILDTKTLKLMGSLESLTIYGFNFKSFPFELSNLRNLKWLSLNYCNLKELPEDLSNFENLIRLDVSKNNIKTIPSLINSQT